MSIVNRNFFRLDVFLRAVIRDHINHFGRTGQIKLRFELGRGLQDNGVLTYQIPGESTLMRCHTVSVVHFDAAVMKRHASVAGFAHGETILKPVDPARGLFVAAWYDILTLEVDHLPLDLAAALREANKVQPVRVHVRFK